MEKNTFCHKTVFFIFSKKEIRCSNLITDFENICKCSKRISFLLDNLNMTQLCIIGEFLPGHILQMVILVKFLKKDRGLG